MCYGSNCGHLGKGGVDSQRTAAWRLSVGPSIAFWSSFPTAPMSFALACLSHIVLERFPGSHGTLEHDLKSYRSNWPKATEVITLAVPTQFTSIIGIWVIFTRKFYSGWKVLCLVWFYCTSPLTKFQLWLASWNSLYDVKRCGHRYFLSAVYLQYISLLHCS